MMPMMNDQLHPAVDGEPLINVVIVDASDAGDEPAPNLPFTVPGLGPSAAGDLIECLQHWLACLIRLQLTTKHAHWNVTGAAFIGVHKMLDDLVEDVEDAVDEVAERIATLGGCAKGTLAYTVSCLGGTNLEDYSLGRADTQAHLHALDQCYGKAVLEGRQGMNGATDDLVTQDMMTGVLQKLEKAQWFIRAHLETGAETIPSSVTSQTEGY